MNGLKECRICKRLLEETDANFYWRKDNEAFRLECRECLSAKAKADYRANQDRRKRKAAEYRARVKNDPEKLAQSKAAAKEYAARYNSDPRNAEKLSARRAEYDAKPKNRARRNELAKARRQANPERAKQRQRNWCAANPERVREHNRKRIERAKQRYATEPEFRIRKLISNEVNRMIALNGGVKGGSILSFLPFTPTEIKAHLENHPKREDWMTWENYGPACKGKRTWQLDHVIPQSKLPYDSMSHPNFKVCWALENLQPLESIANIRKGNK